MSKPPDLAIIMGSSREGRLCDRVTDWALSQIRDRYNTDVIDPRTLDLPNHIEASDNPAVTALQRRIAASQAFLVVTPEYNHGYPAALKQIIDYAQPEWHAKPVAFLSYGGVSGGLRAVEQSRLVFAEVHAVTLRDSVSFANAGAIFADTGPDARSEASMASMLARLDWWTQALSDARAKSPYPSKA